MGEVNERSHSPLEIISTPPKTQGEARTGVVKKEPVTADKL